MKNVLIINEGYSNNLGDQAIKDSMSELFAGNGYSTDFLFFAKPEITSLPKYDYLKFNKGVASDKMTLLVKIKSLVFIAYWYFHNVGIIKSCLVKNDYDLVVIGGGQLINSSGNKLPHGFAVALYWFTYLIRKFSKAKIFLIGVGCVDSFNSLERRLYKSAFEKIDRFWVRDSFSKEVLEKQFLIGATLMPDIAFYSHNNSVYGEIHQKNNVALIGVTNYNEVFLRYNKSTFNKDDYFTELFKVVEKYQKDGLEVKLFYTTILDAHECLSFRGFVENTYNIHIEICDLSNLSDLKLLLANANRVYSGRMHALILAMKYAAIPEAYLISQKLRSFNDEYITSGVPASNFSNRIKELFENFI